MSAPEQVGRFLARVVTQGNPKAAKEITRVVEDLDAPRKAVGRRFGEALRELISEKVGTVDDVAARASTQAAYPKRFTRVGPRRAANAIEEGIGKYVDDRGAFRVDTMNAPLKLKDILPFRSEVARLAISGKKVSRRELVKAAARDAKRQAARKARIAKYVKYVQDEARFRREGWLDHFKRALKASQKEGRPFRWVGGRPPGIPDEKTIIQDALKHLMFRRQWTNNERAGYFKKSSAIDRLKAKKESQVFGAPNPYDENTPPYAEMWWDWFSETPKAEHYSKWSEAFDKRYPKPKRIEDEPQKLIARALRIMSEGGHDPSQIAGLLDFLKRQSF